MSEHSPLPNVHLSQRHPNSKSLCENKTLNSPSHYETKINIIFNLEQRPEPVKIPLLKGQINAANDFD